jgi:hypothetical protein
MSSKLPDILENTKTVQNARKFEEMDGADMAIC